MAHCRAQAVPPISGRISSKTRAWRSGTRDDDVVTQHGGYEGGLPVMHTPLPLHNGAMARGMKWKSRKKAGGGEDEERRAREE